MNRLVAACLLVCLAAPAGAFEFRLLEVDDVNVKWGPAARGVGAEVSYGFADRAQAAGLVERVPDATDLRVVRLVLTDAGERMLRQLSQAHLDELARLDRWAEGKPRQVATILAPQIGLDIEVAELAASRFAYGIRPIDAAIMVAQQRIADTFHELKLIPRAIRVADALPAGASADPASAR